MEAITHDQMFLQEQFERLLKEQEKTNKLLRELTKVQKEPDNPSAPKKKTATKTRKKKED